MPTQQMVPRTGALPQQAMTPGGQGISPQVLQAIMARRAAMMNGQQPAGMSPTMRGALPQLTPQQIEQMRRAQQLGVMEQGARRGALPQGMPITAQQRPTGGMPAGGALPRVNPNIVMPRPGYAQMPSPRPAIYPRRVGE